jgi:hypothetical protein
MILKVQVDHDFFFNFKDLLKNSKYFLFLTYLYTNSADIIDDV